MNTKIEIQQNESEISKEIQFLKKEMEFLLNLLKNGYSNSVEIEKIKLLDTFWKGFEDNIIRLNNLFDKIKREENDLGSLYIGNSRDEKKSYQADGDIMFEYGRISKTVKALKENFYEYMSGCCACSFRKK